MTDFRTWISGVREEDLRGAPSFTDVQKRVSDLITGRILVGHAIGNDLQVCHHHPHVQSVKWELIGKGPASQPSRNDDPRYAEEQDVSGESQDETSGPQAAR